MAEVERRFKAEQQAEICRVFANPTRILILWALTDGEKSVSELAEAVGASLQSTSQHLRIMRQTEILVSRREGHMVFYRIARTGVDEASDASCQLLLEAAPAHIS
jgi:ArsR family transcriptional regulator